MREKIWRPSPNFEPRRGRDCPDMIIIHYTGTLTAEEAAGYYLNEVEDKQAGKISPHYMIDRDGSIIQFVDESMRAWHAGKACWRGERDINSRSVGIELVNPGHENGYEPFHEAQVTALIQLCREIIERYNIVPVNVLGHSDIAPGRKLDPGEFFDWRRLSGEGVGVWPEDTGDLVLDVHQALLDMGYDPDASFDDLLYAFQQHFVPEALSMESKEGLMLTSNRLAGLKNLAS